MLLLGGQITGCASPPNPLVPDGVLRVGTSGDYAPFSYVAPGAPGPAGFDIDLALHFAADRGLEPRFVAFRWPMLVADLEARRFDVAMSGVTVRPERSIAGRFTLPVATSGAVAIVASTSPVLEVGGLDRTGNRIGVNAGGHLERVTRARFPSASIVTADRNTSLPGRLAAGEVDAIVSDTLEAPHWLAALAALGHEGGRVLGPFTRDRKAWLLRAEDVRLAQALDRWLLQREADGTLDRMRRKHLGAAAAAERSAEPFAALLAAVDERLSLMPAVAETKRMSGRAVEDLAQEERVLASATASVARAAASARARLPAPDAVRAFFQAQIDAAKAIQRQTLDGPPALTAGRNPDLETQLRPALARVGDRITRLVVALPRCEGADGCDPESVFSATVAALDGRDLAPEHLAAIARALTHLTESAGSVAR